MFTLVTPLMTTPLVASASTSSAPPTQKRTHVRRRDASPKPSCSTRSTRKKTLAKMAKKVTASRSKSDTAPAIPRACSSASSQTATSTTTQTSTPMLTIPQPLNYAPQTFNFPSATLPLPLPLPLTNPTTSPAVPITIDPLAYISEVYDSLFSSQVAGSSPLIKSIRNLLIKKLLLDHAAQELLFHPILTFDDLISFTLDILQGTSLIS